MVKTIELEPTILIFRLFTKPPELFVSQTAANLQAQCWSRQMRITAPMFLVGSQLKARLPGQAPSHLWLGMFPNREISHEWPGRF